MYDVIVVGAGPIGVATAREAANKGLSVCLVDQGPLLGAMYRYPTHMRFFSSSDKIEICGIPFPTPESRPTRFEALEYYRLVATHQNISWELYQKVGQLRGEKGDFEIVTESKVLKAKFIVLATGFFNQPVQLNIPGEDLPHVSHYFSEGHAYAGLKTTIVGAANSAVIAALECWRHGADVTLVHRGPDFHSGVKYWLRPDIENRIKEGAIKVKWNCEIESIEQDSVTLKANGGSEILKSDRNLLLTGYRADFDWIKSLGIDLDPNNRPKINEATFESVSREGVYCSGCILCGNITNELFIENGRFHAEVIANELASL